MTTWGTPSLACITFRWEGPRSPGRPLVGAVPGHHRDQGAAPGALPHVLTIHQRGKFLVGLCADLSCDTVHGRKYKKHGKMHKSHVISQPRTHCCSESNFADLCSHGAHTWQGTCVFCLCRVHIILQHMLQERPPRAQLGVPTGHLFSA